MHTEYQIVEKAIHYLTEHQGSQPSLPEISAQAGLSPHHFQRVFSRWAGVSPKRMLQYLTSVQAGELLRRRMPVLDTSLSVGLSGTSRLHDLFVTIHGMSPAAYREHGADLYIRWGVTSCDFGQALIATTDSGICWLSFHDDDTLEDGVEQMRAEWFRSQLERDDTRISALAPGLLDSPANRHPVHVLVKGSNFQIRVWEALLAIPPGSTSTYGDLAQMIERPGASRAIGTAIGSNRVSWLIPCHRVIRKTGMIGGYRWGPHRKCMMLLKELNTERAVAV